MRRAVRAVAVTVVTLGLAPVLQGHAWACSCAVSGTPPTESEEYTAGARALPRIYVGTVTKVRHTGERPTGTDHYTVRVSETLKGPRVTSYELHTSDNSGTCGVALELREPILVLDDGHGNLGSCGELTTQQRVPQRAAIVRAALRSGPTMPRTGGDGTGLWVLAAGAALLLARRRAVTGAA